MSRHLLSLVVVVGTAAAAQGEVAVELLNMPTRVHSFEPVYVLYSIENTGTTPVYIPAQGAPDRGPGVYFARAGEAPRWVGMTGDWAVPHAEETAWLAPGERWLVYEDISYWLGVLEGDVSVQAVLSSNGRCGDQQVAGRRSYPLQPLRLQPLRVGVRTFPVYRCWEGEVRSNVWTLTVERATSPEDLQAHEYLVGRGALLHDRESDRWLLIRGSGLEDRFPSSHYTYAFLARGTSSSRQQKRAIELQPAHPLNSWVNGAITREALKHQLGRSVGRMAEELDLPVGFVEYLEQHAWNLEHRGRADPPVVRDDRRPREKR